jgi:hypothetical protein
LGLIHFVVAAPGELDRAGVAATDDLAGDALEGELAGAVALEEDVGRLHHVGEVILVVRHLDDPPSAQDVHAGPPAAWAGG